MERNRTIDLVKLIAAICVSLIHLSVSMPEMYLDNDYTLVANYIGRFAVPFFFLTSGYYVTNYQKALVKTIKLYTLFMSLILVANVVLMPFGLGVYGSIKWYFFSYAAILVLLSPKNKTWWSIVFVASIVYNVTVNMMPIDPAISFGGMEVQNNAIVYAALFIIGNKLRSQNLKVIDNKLGYILLTLGFIMCIYNGLYGMSNQFHLFSQLTAFIIFTGAMIASVEKPSKFALYSEDIFIYHCLFLFIPNAIGLQSFFILCVCAILIPFLSIYMGKLIRYIDQKYWSGYVFKNSSI